MRWRDRAKASIAQEALTNSKNPHMLINGLYPTHIKGAHGCYLYDTSDKKYLDFICGLGTNLFGYGNDLINQKIQKVMYNGFSHSLPTIYEVEAAEAIKEMFPAVDMVKFLKTGGDACNAAVKIARNYTGRSKVLSDGYHGWGDIFVSLTPPACGVTDHFDIEKLEAIDNIDNTVAAVIIEPVITDYSNDRRLYLQQLRKRCSEVGAVLIFDEVITGFRFEKYSVTEWSGVDPDLLCLGKAISNGLPLSCVAGGRDLMDDASYFISSTYAGEILSLVACKEVVRLLLHDSNYDIKRLWVEGEKFRDHFNENSPDNLKMVGYPTRGVFSGSEEMIALLMQEMAKANILFCKSWFYNFCHYEINDYISNVIEGILDKIKSGRCRMEYPMPKSPFSMGLRNDRGN